MRLEGKVIEVEEGKEYFVSKEIKRNKKTYLYMTNIEKPKNTNFYELINNELYMVTDSNLLKKLLFEAIKD